MFWHARSPDALPYTTLFRSHPWLPEACLAVLLLLVGALTLDTYKRARARYGARPVVTTTSRTPPSTTHEDLPGTIRDRKSTRLNSSHVATSYPRSCLKRKSE